MTRPIAVIAEHLEGLLKPVTEDLIACARLLGYKLGAPVRLVLVGDRMKSPAWELARGTGLNVTSLSAAGFQAPDTERSRSLLTDYLVELDASHVLLAHSSVGLDLAPGLALALGASCITGVEGLEAGDDGMNFLRGLRGGKRMASVHSEMPVTLLTVMQGSFARPAMTSEGDVAMAGLPPASGNVDEREVHLPSSRSRFLGLRQAVSQDAGLRDARCIVSAGRGIGSKDKLALIRELAELFDNAAVASSRPLCDLGWLDYGRQVGLTGATVAPALYLACGISGSAQHLAGIRGAGSIVAVNIDPHAAIFNLADVCVVADLAEFIPAFIKAVKRLRSKASPESG